VISPEYGGAVVSTSVSAKLEGFNKEKERSAMVIEVPAASGGNEWSEIHRLVFANGSATNETIALSRAANYRRFRIKFAKGVGTMRLGSFAATWRKDGEIAVPYALCAEEVTADSFHAAWAVDEPVDSFLFDCWNEYMTPWSGREKWTETFARCANTTKNAKQIAADMFDNYTDKPGWSGDFVYLPALSEGVLRVNKTSGSVGWLVSPELPAMEGVELVVRARAVAEQPDHVMPVFLIRGGETNDLAAFELSASYAEYHCPIAEISAGDRLVFKSFSVGSQRCVLIDSVKLVEEFVPGSPATNTVCENVVVEYSDSPGFFVDGLLPGSRYGFSVRAVSGGSVSLAAEACTVHTLSREGAEDASEWVGAAASDVSHTSFRLDWPHVTGAAGYRVSVWTNMLVGASSGTVEWSEQFSKSLANSSSSPRAINDSEKFYEGYADNAGWTIVSNIYPSSDTGSVRIGNTSNPGELWSPPLRLSPGKTLRVKARRQTGEDGAIFAVYRLSGETLSPIGDAAEIGDLPAECIWQLPEMGEGDCLVFRSASGKSKFRTILDEVEIVDGYVAGTSVPDRAADAAIDGAENSFFADSLSPSVWTYAVEAVDSDGTTIAAFTNEVDLANPPPNPVLDAVAISGIQRKGDRRVYREDFSSFTNVFTTGNNADWLNGVTLAYWQAYYSEGPVATIIRNKGSGTTKGLYAYWVTNVVSTYSLGTLTAGSAGDFIYGLSFRNDTAFAVNGVNVKFDAMQFGFKNTTEQVLEFEYLVTNELVSIAAPGSWQSCDDLAFVTQKDANSGLKGGEDPPWTTEISSDVDDVKIPTDGYLLLRWRRPAASNAAAMAIDNVSVSFAVQARPLTIVIR
jgi:hypothetical protein